MKIIHCCYGTRTCTSAFELALQYSQERKQFGKPICKFQANAFKLADMATRLISKELLYKACWLKRQ